MTSIRFNSNGKSFSAAPPLNETPLSQPAAASEEVKEWNGMDGRGGEPDSVQQYPYHPMTWS